jgi:hypothetical protein
MWSLTGAEKPRNKAGTGGSGTFRKVKSWLASVIHNTLLIEGSSAAASCNGNCWPARSSKPMLSGIKNGNLVGWRGVGGQVCFTVSVNVHATGS